jgi:hypothetical protein
MIILKITKVENLDKIPFFIKDKLWSVANSNTYFMRRKLI